MGSIFMIKRKLSPEEKITAVESYLNGAQQLHTIVEHYGIAKELFFRGYLFGTFGSFSNKFRPLRQLLFLQNNSGTGGKVQLHNLLIFNELGGIGHMGYQLLATILLIVTGQSNGVFCVVVYGYRHIGLGLTGVEIESEEEAVPGEYNYLFCFLQEPEISHPLREGLVFLGQLHHILVKIV